MGKESTTKAKEPETKSDKKAAKAVSGEGKGAGKAVKQAKAEGNGKAKEKGPTIGGRAVELLNGGTSAKETLETILKEFPGAKTTMACIYWYANHNGIKLQKPAAPKTEKQQPTAKAA